MDVPKLEQERSVVVEVGSLDEHLKNVDYHLLHILTVHSQNCVAISSQLPLLSTL